MTEIRLPRLLDEEMRERARLHPVAARARMRLNALSTAEVTLDEEDAPIRVRDMVELYGPQGSLGIFRVSALQAAGDGLRLAEMEHGLCTLEDDVTPPGTVLQGAIGDVVNTLLQWQSRPIWKLGTVESGVVLAETEADGANLLETLLAVAAIDESLMIETDQQALPWVLHLKKMPAETGCECRLNRNLDDVTVSLDGSELCTRVTAVLPDGTSVTRDGDTVDTWGVVHRAIVLDENQDPETEIRKYLEEHKNPGVSVELEAVALAALTGEPLDRFSLGGLCRVALPEWNTVISERVVVMAYDDLFGEPGKVKLTLCSQTLDAAALLARLRAEQRRSSRQMFRFIRETKNGVEILAEEILLRATKTEVAELNGVLTDKISEVSVELDAANAQLRLKANQEYVDQQFSATELLLDGANARIDANALRIDEANKQISAANLAIDGANARIDAEAKRIDEANGEISSAKLAIDGANAAITAEVTRATEAEGELTGKLEVTTEAITAEVTRATGEEEKLAGRIKITEDSITEQAGKITEQGKLISGAEERIDGLNKTITDVAGDVSELDGSLSGVRTKLDGLEKTVTTQAGTIDAQGKLIEGAQSQIDGINAKITDFATHTEVTDLGKTVNTVSETLDAVKGEVETKVSQETFDKLGKRVDTAETKITQNADAIELRATKTEMNAAIQVEADKITSVVGRADALEDKMAAAEKNITNAQTRITQTEKDIALKANATTVSEIDGRLKKAEASITVNANNIVSKVSQSDFNNLEKRVVETETDISNAEKRITNAETAITQTQTAIKQKADATVVYGLTTTVNSVSSSLDSLKGEVATKVSQTSFNTLSGRVTTAESRITQTANQITSVVGDVDDLDKTVNGYRDQSTGQKVEGLTDKVKTVTTGLGNAWTSINQTKEAIALKADADVVNDLGKRLGTAETTITQTAKDITLKANQTTVDAIDKRLKTAESSITVNATNIESKVSKGSLISSINQSAESITISASKVNLTGYVTAQKLQADYLTAKQIEAKYITADEVAAKVSDFVDTWSDNAAFGTLSVVNGNITSLSCSDITIGGNGFPTAVNESIFSKPHYHTVSESGGTVTIGGPATSPGTFKIADTKFYKDGVSAAAKAVKDDTWDDMEYDSSGKTADVYCTLTNGNSIYHSYNVAGIYNAGANSVNVKKISWSNPAKGVVQCHITLTNGVERAPSYNVPSSWM